MAKRRTYVRDRKGRFARTGTSYIPRGVGRSRKTGKGSTQKDYSKIYPDLTPRGYVKGGHTKKKLQARKRATASAKRTAIKRKGHTKATGSRQRKLPPGWGTTAQNTRDTRYWEAPRPKS